MSSPTAQALAVESLFPHSVSFDHFDPELYDENFGNHDGPDPLAASGGALARLGEHIPLVSSGLQMLHELAGNQEALERARKSDPLGRDGFFTHAAEYVPVINSIVQAVHQAGEDEESLQRARERNPIGSHGYLTKALEHIPIVSDGMVALHRYQGDGVAAERARGYSLEKLLSRDGAFTRVAELLPGSNLLAAWMHKMNGDSERMARALNLFESWGAVSNPDSGLWQMAELLPGADAVAFAVHLQGGHYAQALRSVTKTSWVNVNTGELILCIRCNSLAQLWCHKVEIHEVDVIPRQFSLVVGLSDLATNFLQIDQQVGAIFRRDGIGLRDEYQISGPELETMVNIARTIPGVVGERMLGGGDKGASGAILLPYAEQSLRNAVDTGYKRSYPQLADKCAVHVVRACKGVEVLEGLL